jgi:hypothetical protein
MRSAVISVNCGPAFQRHRWCLPLREPHPHRLGRAGFTYGRAASQCRIVKAMAQAVLPTNQEDREVYLREHNASNFIKAVSTTKAKADTLIMMLDAFLDEPEVLYGALNYARDEGVSVTMAPKAT